MIRRVASSATLLLLLFFTLPGCGGGGGGGQGETPKPPPPTEPAKPQAGTPPPTAQQGAETGGEEDEDSPLLAWADVDNDEGKAPFTVNFKADIEGGKAPLKIVWKFGDGTPDGTEANPTHTYTKPGKYKADLEVSDSAGDSDSDYVEIEVQ